MPKANLAARGVDIFYELHCSKCGTLGEHDTECGCKHAYHILLVMGFQARGEAWKFNLDALLSFKPPGQGTEDNEVMCCWLDNRGVGESSHPQDKKDYSTTAMADDALALMDHIGWDKAHIFGHSMGGMICCKIASKAPDRVYSMALLGVTGGGSQAVKSIAKRLPGIIKHGGGWAKTTEQKARATLYFHFSRKWLKEALPGEGTEGAEAGTSMSGISVSSNGSFKSTGSMRRKEVFLDEYMKTMEEDKLSTPHGTNGQANAVLNHSVTVEDIRRIKSGGFPISVVHGRKDVVAGIKYADKLARKLGASFVVTDAGHFITRESLDEVNHTLLALMARVHNPPPKSYWGTTLRQMKTVSKAVSALKAGSAAVIARVPRPSLEHATSWSRRASQHDQPRPAAIGECPQEPLEATPECPEAMPSDRGASTPAALPSEGQGDEPITILKPQLVAPGPDSPDSSTSPVMAVPPDASVAPLGTGSINSSSARVATLGVV